MTPTPDPRPTPPTQAGPLRRAFHTLIALAGWVIFVWWWYLVLGRLDPSHVRWTVTFIVLTLLLSVLLTAAWAFHNLRIFRLRGPRTQVPRTTYVFQRDRLGRPIVFASAQDAIGKAPVVEVKIEPQGKTYHAADRLPPREGWTTTGDVTVPVPQPGTTTHTERIPLPPPRRKLESDDAR